MNVDTPMMFLLRQNESDVLAYTYTCNNNLSEKYCMAYCIT